MWRTSRVCSRKVAERSHIGSGKLKIKQTDNPPRVWPDSDVVKIPEAEETGEF